MNNVNIWVEVKKENLIQNIQNYKKLIGEGVKIMPVIKSNAYGHGIAEVAESIEPYVDIIGTVNLQEALFLREKGREKPIFILSFFLGSEDEIAEAMKKNIGFPLYKKEDAMLLSEIAKKNNLQARVHLKIDTGASRVGVLCDEAVEFALWVRTLPAMKIEGIYSHFAGSEEPGDSPKNQKEKFEKILGDLQNLGFTFDFIHFACSAATFTAPDSRYNTIRLGIGLYGLWPSEYCKELMKKHHPEFELKPVLTWKTRIIHIKNIPENTPVGYGGTFVTERPSKIAVLPVGYWDGYDRGFSNNAEVLISGQRCKILGRICMNLCMVDVTDVSDVSYDSEVVLLGGQKNELISAEELAGKINTINYTINYELVTRINPLIPRILV